MRYVEKDFSQFLMSIPNATHYLLLFHDCVSREYKLY